MTTSTADAFASLAALELITARQRMAVERHPACASFLALHDPVQQLLWMHAHKIISEDELDDMASFDDEPCEREAILQAALLEIERANDLRNGRFLDRLLREGMITPIQHAAALRDPSGLYHETAADMLYELVLFDILSPPTLAPCASAPAPTPAPMAASTACKWSKTSRDASTPRKKPAAAIPAPSACIPIRPTLAASAGPTSLSSA